MNDFRVRITVRNNRILKRIEECGFKSQSEFARHFGIGIQYLSDLITFKVSPVTIGGEWKEVTNTICCALGVEHADLWPKHMENILRRKASVEFSTDEAGIRSLAAPSQMVVDRKALQHLIQKANLTPMQEKVLNMRMGFDGEEKTFRQCSEVTQRSVERLRQIEIKALLKLRSAAKRNKMNMDDFEAA